MVSRIEALYDWLHTHEGRKIFRYTMVSVISSSVSLFVIFIVYGVLRLWSEVPSTVFGNVVATFPSYWLNRKWAWGKHGRSHFLKEVVPFWTMAAIGIAFAIVGASLAKHIGKALDLDHVGADAARAVGQRRVVRASSGLPSCSCSTGCSGLSSRSSTSTCPTKRKSGQPSTTPH